MYFPPQTIIEIEYGRTNEQTVFFFNTYFPRILYATPRDYRVYYVFNSQTSPSGRKTVWFTVVVITFLYVYTATC